MAEARPEVLRVGWKSKFLRGNRLDRYGPPKESGVHNRT